MRRLAMAIVLAALLVPAAPAEARRCRNVGSYHVVAFEVRCDFARDATRTWLRSGRTPRRWSCVKRRTSLSCARGERTFGAYRPR